MTTITLLFDAYHLSGNVLLLLLDVKTSEMKLYVDNKCPMGSIQKQFNAFYPFLKLEFFSDRLTYKATPLACELVRHLFSKNMEGTINVENTRTVAEVENDFKNEFGLAAQIFRQSGKVWIGTTLTNDWTLEKQNKEGEQITGYFESSLPKGSGCRP